MDIKPEGPRPHAIEVLDDEMARLYAGMTGAERLAMTNQMFRSTRDMLLSHLQKEHPDWSDVQVCDETARRLSRGAV